MPPHFGGSHRSIETLGLYLVGGDYGEYNKYVDIVSRIEHHDRMQTATDALTLILIDKFPTPEKGK